VRTRLRRNVSAQKSRFDSPASDRRLKGHLSPHHLDNRKSTTLWINRALTMLQTPR
jgi:hypothetical protein